ncbi:hypothetical protein [Streptomyces sp. NPDC050355]|uniref:hypothetical protein n=1 Tax=Streptomyces sp. NPDC050355 TaxID=3365609 RepID=UPI0037AE9C60
MAVAKTSTLVLDAAEPEELAEFYARFLGGRQRVGSHPDYIEIVEPAGVRIVVRRA